MKKSFNEIRELVQKAIVAAIAPDSYCYIIDLYDDNVIYEGPCKEGKDKYYQRSYSILDDVVSLGEAVEVERKVSYEPLKAACQLQAAAEGDTTGYKWRVKVLEFGPDKPGAIWWDKDVMTAALAKFEGAKVFALAEGQHQAKPHPFGKSVKDLVGVLQNAQATAAAIYADLIILPAAQWLRDNLVGCAEQGLTDVIGLSVDVSGKQATRKDGSKSYRSLATVASVTVDVVYDPAAGGAFLTMTAAVPSTNQEDSFMNKEQLLAALKAARPAQYAQINPETVTEAELLTMLAATPADLDTRIQAAVTAALQAANPTAAAHLEEVKLVACGMTLDRELAASKLPEAAQDTIRLQFADKVFEASALQAAIKSTKEMLDRLAASGVPVGTGDIRVTVDTSEKASQMLDDFFAGKVQSFKACYQDITGDQQITGDLRRASRLTAAISTTTFDQLLGDSITRRMVAEYNASGLTDWRKIATVTPVFDFRSQRRVRIGGYGDLPAVAQAAAYAALTTPADEEATYTASKRGGTESISIEAIKNDDVTGIRRVPIKLGRSAARTLYKFVFDLVSANPTIYDSVALFHASHGGNLGTSALAKATLQAGRLAMLKQQELTSTEPLGIPPKSLLVPLDLADTAFELTVQPNIAGFNPTAADSIKSQIWDVIPVKHWTDTNNWFLVADPNDIPTIEVGFLDGKEEPELFVQDLPNVGSLFSNDQITYKIRHIYGGAIMDFRGFYGAVVP